MGAGNVRGEGKRGGMAPHGQGDCCCACAGNWLRCASGPASACPNAGAGRERTTDFDQAQIQNNAPFVRASTTPAFSRYLRNSSFLASGVCGREAREEAHGGSQGPQLSSSWRRTNTRSERTPRAFVFLPREEGRSRGARATALGGHEPGTLPSSPGCGTQTGGRATRDCQKREMCFLCLRSLSSR